MKKILLSVLTLAVVLGTAGYLTYAYFTDKATILGNTTAAGRLNFTLNGDMTETKKVTLVDMEPGIWYGPYKMDIYNLNSPLSTMAIKYRSYDTFQSETVPGFYDKLYVRAAHSHCVSTPPDWTADPSKVKYEGPLSGLEFDSPTDAITAPTGSLAVNNTHCWMMSFKVHENATNTFQGASATFDVVVDGTQVGNPGW